MRRANWPRPFGTQAGGDTAQDVAREFAQGLAVALDEEHRRERIDHGNPREEARDEQRYEMKLLQTAYDGDNGHANGNYIENQRRRSLEPER